MLGSGLSAFLLNVAGGWSGLRANSPLPYREILGVAAFGPADYRPLPTSSWWWLAIDGPHTNTPFSLLGSAGIAMALMAGFLLLARVAENALTPITAAGTMTLTLYSTHLVFITLADIETLSFLWFAIQIGVAALFATAWHFSLGRGPLEQVVATSSRVVSAAVNRAGLVTGRHAS